MNWVMTKILDAAKIMRIDMEKETVTLSDTQQVKHWAYKKKYYYISGI